MEDDCVEKQEMTIKSLIEMIESNKHVFEMMMDTKMDYSPQSVKKLEKNLNEMFPFGRQVAPQVSIMLGAYLGEVIKRNIETENVSIEWTSVVQEFLFETGLEIKGAKVNGVDNGNIVIKPLMRVDKFLNHDRTDSMWAMYCMTQDVCGGNLQMSSDGKWKESPRGYTYRMTEAKMN